MGEIFLHAWPDYMAEWRVEFRLVDGWRDRARSSGGIDQLLGIWCHHTVSNTTPERDVNFCINVSGDAPIGSGILARDGVFHYHTSGATNTNGRGGPWFTSLGVIPLDNGNRNGAAIEAANDGVGEEWPAAQRDAYVRLCASFVDMARREFGLPMEVDSILAHHEWAPDRKTDPSGPPDPWGGPGRTVWRMDEFRGDVFTALLPPPIEPPPTVEEDLLYINKRTAAEYHLGNQIVARKLGKAQAQTEIRRAVRDGRPLLDFESGEVVDQIGDVHVAAAWRGIGVLVNG